MPRKARAKIPPIAERGIAVKIRAACLTELKAKNKSKKIRNNAIGTAIPKRFLAAFKFSKAPP